MKCINILTIERGIFGQVLVFVLNFGYVMIEDEIRDSSFLSVTTVISGSVQFVINPV